MLLKIITVSLFCLLFIISFSLTGHSKTIGPTAPPSDFKPVNFLKYIIDLKHQSASLGWINNTGVENSLDVKLDNAKTKLAAGDFKTVTNILTALISEVETQGCPTYEGCAPGKHLRPEAYALLKYNCQYLLEQLGGKAK